MRRIRQRGRRKKEGGNEKKKASTAALTSIYPAAAAVGVGRGGFHQTRNRSTSEEDGPHPNLPAIGVLCTYLLISFCLHDALFCSSMAWASFVQLGSFWVQYGGELMGISAAGYWIRRDSSRV